MKRLTLSYRKLENGKTKTYRITVSEPVDNIDAQQLQTYIAALKTLGVVPEGYEPDEARVIETNTEVLLNMIE